MKNKIINEIKVSYSADISDSELMKYIEYVQKKSKDRLIKLEVKLDGEDVELAWEFKPIPFERIRRITGYLTGDMSTWNAGKKAEEHDRVKHGTEIERL